MSLFFQRHSTLNYVRKSGSGCGEINAIYCSIWSTITSLFPLPPPPPPPPSHTYTHTQAFFSFGGGYPEFGGHSHFFFERYSCYPMVFSTKNSEEIKHGGKIIMPSSALEKLARLNISYPMLFKLSNKNRSTHCGVLEFVAEEGRIYIPHWVRACPCLVLPHSIPCIMEW